MHTSYITLKSGEKIEGPIWEFKPLEGYISIVTDTEDSPRRIELRDIQEAYTPGVRIRANKLGIDNLLQRAKEGGWIDDSNL